MSCFTPLSGAAADEIAGFAPLGEGERFVYASLCAIQAWLYGKFEY